MDDLTAFTDPEFLATQEHLSRYRADGSGYLSVGLGDVLGEGRYVLRHKLGFGGFGIVWLGWELGLVFNFPIFSCFFVFSLNSWVWAFEFVLGLKREDSRGRWVAQNSRGRKECGCE